ncbi:hypothetical protein JK2ML_1001 [Mycobacterium leprae Kyoto-2]|uniref:Uncharacterized protein n=3 Tax=Mycobacterium leprae TaxID=1769 RepID=Q9CCB9_MYCLE|nr:hypothetical protein DIJ64_05365 [Mycobacterium leprae]OAR21458.1 hypothetical protein A8144_06010 [Mycobacterium leprae 3125609]OAX71283.1 hypothetical protein A3216_06660 [Mycobacterium leprae 7935681]CAR71096.1 hypothetical protein MLBr01001 [Mycobacterium leprae Br4923]BBC16903.1 hypothetical protein JK2ML_1001 [Mycobacterium leprae Kyoto-2]
MPDPVVMPVPCPTSGFTQYSPYYRGAQITLLQQTILAKLNQKYYNNRYRVDVEMVLSHTGVEADSAASHTILGLSSSILPPYGCRTKKQRS